MTVAFYADENFPSPVIHALRKQGVEILTVIEDGHGGRPDDEILRRATELGRVVLTHDYDFFEIVRHCQETSQQFAGVCFTVQNKLSYRELIEELMFVDQVGIPDDFRERIVVIPLRSH